MTDINNLNLEDEDLGIDHDALPNQGGGFAETPQPGPYVFRTPENISEYWNEFMYTDGNTPKKGLRLAKDDKDKYLPVEIVWSKTGKYVGDEFRLYINSQPKKRGKEGTLVSDLVYFAIALDPTAKPKTLKDVVEVINKAAGKMYTADVELDGQCNPKREAYGEDGEKMDDTVGCGQRYGMKSRKIKNTGEQVIAIPREETGDYKTRFKCVNCDAWIRLFPRQTRYRPYVSTEQA